MSKPRKKLFLLDAMALIYRAHFAFSKNPRINSKGMNTGAALGFTNTLVEVLQKEKPTHIGVAFDSAAKTFRHDNFAAYKANRQAMPEDISLAIPYCKKIVEAFNIPVLILDGYEADDIIGTMACKAEKAGFDVYMMTPDKDYCQLVTEHVFLYKPAFLGNAVEVWDVNKVLEKWEIENVSQVIDILGLQGDAVDNIPGIPGIGEKTAKALIQKYGSVENLIANSHELKGKQKENVENFADQGIMSKELATIHCDVPLEFSEESLHCDAPNEEQLINLFNELEFRQLAQRVLGQPMAAAAASVATKTAKRKTSESGQTSLFGAIEAPVEETIVDDAVPVAMRSFKNSMADYHLINTPELHESLVSYLERQEEISFDTETTSIDAITARLVGMSFSYRPGEAYYIPVPANDKEETLRIVSLYKNVLENPAIQKVGQNIKYDIMVLKNYGVEVQGPLFDTMLAHYLLEPEMRHNMDVLSETYLNYTPIPITDLIGPKGKNQLTMADLAPEDVKDYACEDADVTLRLKLYFEPLLQERNLMKLFHEVETPLVQVLADVEREGITIDSDALADISTQLESEIITLEKRIFEIAGTQFNIGSPKQLGEILFDRLELQGKSKLKKTKTGQHATGEEVLSKLAGEHEIVRLILDHRQLTKLKSTYVDALPQLVCSLDGRVHTSFNQAVTATGRLSSTNPNLQNIPVRTERGREIRKAFVPRDNKHLLISADYSQIELRIMADFSGDPTMKEAFKNGLDIHASTASKVFHVPLDQVDGEMRRKAKTINFGIIYGISAFGLAERLSIPRREAADIIEAYFQEFPAVKEYMDEAINKAREDEYVETLLGRRRYLRDINSRNQNIRGFAERNAINAPIQGTAADIIKIAMINIHEYLKQENLKTRMILQVHDELLFDTPKEEVEIVTPKIVELMTNALPLSVPMEVGLGVGDNWLEAH
ncbi:DNA polymerase I [Pontibacter sp. BT310]|uniref:DNA polymerase I n=1 Tax=Pontibacter populi TaxID=890055 RepID=A0ABS6XBR8_9BACT|nr:MULTISPECIES: DNA polymerase I [Pontibacter]MBJ6117758.1 DNA polymerase I [Pontibacter sp. BT310]MBR0570184.1 DNA polymerase I [Microvirga sp. STS03]MBW3364610.1 DNA polymerase I [Pontibacter populi]